MPPRAPMRPAITIGCGSFVSFSLAAVGVIAPAGSAGSTNWLRTVAGSISSAMHTAGCTAAMVVTIANDATSQIRRIT